MIVSYRNGLKEGRSTHIMGLVIQIIVAMVKSRWLRLMGWRRRKTMKEKKVRKGPTSRRIERMKTILEYMKLPPNVDL